MTEALPTILVALALAGIVALIVRKLVRDKKSGSGCGCGCGGCPNAAACGKK